jgi:hypothetical protein
MRSALEFVRLRSTFVLLAPSNSNVRSTLEFVRLVAIQVYFIPLEIEIWCLQ